ncbi:MAG: hypothetical protein KDI82_08065, partial [Gammaproteobacteria bacterium]|nr:hypothetical protein [Gammaproteobacteria bacterium]
LKHLAHGNIAHFCSETGWVEPPRTPMTDPELPGTQAPGCGTCVSLKNPKNGAPRRTLPQSGAFYTIRLPGAQST